MSTSANKTKTKNHGPRTTHLITHIEPELLDVAVSFRIGEAEANSATMPRAGGPQTGSLPFLQIPPIPDFGVRVDDPPASSVSVESSPASTALEEAQHEAFDDGLGTQSVFQVMTAVQQQERA